MATLWQRQKDRNLKPIAFASRFLSDTEKKYAKRTGTRCSSVTGTFWTLHLW